MKHILFRIHTAVHDMNGTGAAARIHVMTVVHCEVLVPLA